MTPGHHAGVTAAGTWEMFTEEQYTANAMRLAPGTYLGLEADWTRKINSFMWFEPSRGRFVVNKQSVTARRATGTARG